MSPFTESVADGATVPIHYRNDVGFFKAVRAVLAKSLAGERKADEDLDLAIRGIDAQICSGDTFHNDRHPDLKADFILAGPRCNISDQGGECLRDDKRWQYDAPSADNANFAWVQHIVHHLAPAGVAGFVLANGSMSSNQASEGEIRKNLIEADLVDCMVALPGQFFYSTQIPVCLWFLEKNESPFASTPFSNN